MRRAGSCAGARPAWTSNARLSGGAWAGGRPDLAPTWPSSRAEGLQVRSGFNRGGGISLCEEGVWQAGESTRVSSWGPPRHMTGRVPQAPFSLCIFVSGTLPRTAMYSAYVGSSLGLSRHACAFRYTCGKVAAAGLVSSCRLFGAFSPFRLCRRYWAALLL